MKLAEPVAAVIAKTAALEDLNPRLFAVLLLAGGAMLICSGLRSNHDQAV